jgi:hypothetical protein
MIIVGGLGTIPGLLAWRSANKAVRGTDDNADKIQKVHKDINSRVTELVASAREAAHAEGMSDEKRRRDNE